MKLSKIFTFLYDLFPYAGTFSDDLYDQNLYFKVGLWNALLSLGLVVLFYYIINNPKFSKLKHWFIILAVNAVFAFGLGFLLPFNVFKALLIEYQIDEYSLFAFKNALISMLWFIFWSYLIKWGSTNAKGTPKFFGKF